MIFLASLRRVGGRLRNTSSIARSGAAIASHIGLPSPARCLPPYCIANELNGAKDWIRNGERPAISRCRLRSLVFIWISSRGWRNGRILVVECKGAHLYEEQAEKRRIGELWARRASEKYRRDNQLCKLLSERFLTRTHCRLQLRDIARLLVES